MERDRFTFFNRRHLYSRTAGSVLLIGLIGLLAVIRTTYSSTYARSWDHVDFALALGRYDLMAMQPHFPGYPYFVLGGMFIHQWVSDPVQALAIFNSIMVLLSVFPAYWLARRMLAPLESLFVCLAVQSLAFLSVMGTEAMSEATAVSLLFWYLWSLIWAREKQGRKRDLLPIVFFGFLMGVRLSYLPFGIGLVLLFGSRWKDFRTNGRFFVYFLGRCLLVLVFQLIWVAGLIVTEGSLVTFISLSLQFVQGHFTEWGGAVTAESTPLLTRIGILVFYNILWVGIAGGSLAGAISMGLAVSCAIYFFLKHRPVFSWMVVWLMVLWISYFMWALFAQNIDKPRHALPLAVLAVFLLFIFVFNKAGHTRRAVWILGPAIAIQALSGIGLIQEKAAEPPAVYQLADYLTGYPEPFTVYTWEEARVMDYLDAVYPYRQVETFEVFDSRNHSGTGRDILLTGHVVEGFRQQGIDLANKVTKIETFTSDRLFDPVYHEIVLYRWEN